MNTVLASPRACCSASRRWLLRAFSTSTSTKSEPGAITTPGIVFPQRGRFLQDLTFVGSGSKTTRPPTKAQQTGPFPPTPEVNLMYSLANKILKDTNEPSAATPQKKSSLRVLQDEIERRDNVKGLEKQRLRRWKVGDVYSPHDLSPAEMRKWGTRQSSKVDAFAALGINPIDEYKVSSTSV